MLCLRNINKLNPIHIVMIMKIIQSVHIVIGSRTNTPRTNTPRTYTPGHIPRWTITPVPNTLGHIPTIQKIYDMFDI